MFIINKKFGIICLQC